MPIIAAIAIAVTAFISYIVIGF